MLITLQGKLSVFKVQYNNFNKRKYLIYMINQATLFRIRPTLSSPLTAAWSLLSGLFCVGFMVLNATYNNISVISWRSVLLVEETGGPEQKHRPVTSHCQRLSNNVVSIEWDSNSQR